MAPALAWSAGKSLPDGGSDGGSDAGRKTREDASSEPEVVSESPSPLKRRFREASVEEHIVVDTTPKKSRASAARNYPFNARSKIQRSI